MGSGRDVLGVGRHGNNATTPAMFQANRKVDPSLRRDPIKTLPLRYHGTRKPHRLNRPHQRIGIVIRVRLNSSDPDPADIEDVVDILVRNSLNSI